MRHRELTVVDPDGMKSIVFRWLPDTTPRAVVHVLHGWAEHAMRYQRPAAALVETGYAVYADDHRGHGQTGLRSDTLGDLGPRGMDGVLDAVHAVTRHAAGEHPQAPVFVLGHSWGSFILQRYLRRWSDEISGALLTGTTFRDAAAPQSRRSPMNARFEPARTAYDWLTRDTGEVDRYIADPLCGFEIMRSRLETAQPPEEGKPRTSLPVLIFNGSDDPIGGEQGAVALADHYRSLGLNDVTVRVYPGARHELFNEVNRDEVVSDVLAWLAQHTQPGLGATAERA